MTTAFTTAAVASLLVVVAGCAATTRPSGPSHTPASTPVRAHTTPSDDHARSASVFQPVPAKSSADAKSANGILLSPQVARNTYTAVILPVYPAATRLADQVFEGPAPASAQAAKLAAQIHQVEAKLAGARFPAQAQRSYAAFSATSKATVAAVEALQHGASFAAWRPRLSNDLVALIYNIGAVGSSLGLLPGHPGSGTGLVPPH
jgi:hypothetical protein